MNIAELCQNCVSGWGPLESGLTSGASITHNFPPWIYPWIIVKFVNEFKLIHISLGHLVIIQYHIISYHTIYIHTLYTYIYIYLYTLYTYMHIMFELQTLGHVRVSLAVPMCRKPWSVVRLRLPPGGSPCLCQETTEKTMLFSGNCLIFPKLPSASVHICFFSQKTVPSLG